MMPNKPGSRSSRNTMMLIAAAAVAVLASGDRSSQAGIQGTGRASISSYGRITGFGSVYVNGMEYDTSRADIWLNHRRASESELALGQVVFVRGRLKAGGTGAEASEVRYDANVRGAVSSVDLAHDRFEVLSQTVRVTDATLFAASIQPGAEHELAVGSLVQVSGFVNAAGELVATRVDPDSAPDPQIRGTVRSLNAAAKTFQVNALMVDYSAAKVTGKLANGSRVKVRGGVFTSTGILRAARVQAFKGRLKANAGDLAALEGIITEFTSTADFAIDGQHIIADADTQFVLHGTELGIDVSVEVQGRIKASGDVLANRVAVTAP